MLTEAGLPDTIAVFSVPTIGPESLTGVAVTVYEPAVNPVSVVVAVTACV
jgi:ABC-type thiamine transport system ATPase subunit